MCEQVLLKTFELKSKLVKKFEQLKFIKIKMNPKCYIIAEAGVKAMQAEADQLMTNPTVRKAYDKFMMLCELTREQNK